jgi:hypothetical protein
VCQGRGQSLVGLVRGRISYQTGVVTSIVAVRSRVGSCDPPEVDRAARRPPGGRQASVGWGPTTPAAPLRTVEVFSALDVSALLRRSAGAEEEAMAVITIQGLTKRFGQVVAVDD